MNRESLMSKPLQNWLQGQGCTPYTEVCIFHSPTDLIGIKWLSPIGKKKIICIEMKTSLTQKLIRQASPLQLVTDHVYCAVPTMPRAAGRAQCANIGIGILSVRNGKVFEILAPARSEEHGPFRDYYRKKTVEACMRIDPGGTAGNPCMKGEGPAQDCYDRVQAYLTSNSGATWNEIYRNVPNHYAHARSMSGAMKMVEVRRRLRDGDR